MGLSRLSGLFNDRTCEIFICFYEKKSSSFLLGSTRHSRAKENFVYFDVFLDINLKIIKKFLIIYYVRQYDNDCLEQVLNAEIRKKYKVIDTAYSELLTCYQYIVYFYIHLYLCTYTYILINYSD